MSAETMTTVVGVKATFNVGGSDAIHHFDSSEKKMNPHPSKGNGKEVDQPSDDKYDHRYSGRHDHGPLPELKTGGLHEELINALLEAKQDSDRFLTSVINEGGGCTESGNGRQGRGNGVGHDAVALEKVPGKAEGVDVDSPTGGTERRQEEATSPEASELQPAKRPKS